MKWTENYRTEQQTDIPALLWHALVKACIILAKVLHYLKMHVA